jgi:hypothetical protein
MHYLHERQKICTRYHRDALRPGKKIFAIVVVDSAATVPGTVE